MKIDTAVKVRSKSHRTARRDASHFSQYSLAVRRLKQSAYLPSALRHSLFPEFLCLSLILWSCCYMKSVSAMLGWATSACTLQTSHVVDITQPNYTFPGSDHAIRTSFVRQQLSQANIFSTTALILVTVVTKVTYQYLTEWRQHNVTLQSELSFVTG